MRQFAIMREGRVANVIEAGHAGWHEGIEVTECVPVPDIGWLYDGAAFMPPEDTPPGAEEARGRIISNLAFDLRFTRAERVAIELASLDDPSKPMADRTQAAYLRVDLERAKKALYTDLDDGVTRESVKQLEALGLLDDGRASEILDAVIRPEERP